MSVCRGYSVAWIFCVLLISGCSIAVRPDHIPALKDYGKVSLTGVSLIVVNVEKDSTEHEIRNDKGAKSGVVANRFVWSSLFVQALAGEFAARGAQVRATAPLTLGIAVSEIIFNQFGNVCQFRIVVNIKASTGWSREYEGIAEGQPKLFESTGNLVNRLANEALAEVIKSILRDDDFLNQLRHAGLCIQTPTAVAALGYHECFRDALFARPRADELPTC